MWSAVSRPRGPKGDDGILIQIFLDLMAGTGLPEYIIFYADDVTQNCSIVKGGKPTANCCSGDWEGCPR